MSGFHIIIEHVVAPESLAQSVHAWVGEVLLPVEPPEIHTVLLSVVQDVLEHILIEYRVLKMPWHNLCGCGIHAHILHKQAEILFVAVHSVSRMKVHGHLQSLFVHPFEKSLRVRNKFLVPCPAGPSFSVPVHIQNHHVDRNMVFLYVCHNVDEVLLRITLVFAIPIAEHEERRHRLFSAYERIVVQSFLILMAVTEEIPVNGCLVNERSYPRHSVHFLVERECAAAVATSCRIRFVDDGPSCTRDQTVLEFRTL